VQRVYHHHAHAAAAYYECKTDAAVLVFTWDGVGYGEDGTLWGGETFLGRPGAWQRVASLRPFRLPGGDKAGREPWRSAAALCWEIDRSCDGLPEKDPLLKQAWQQKINAQQSTSAGRLFDAAAMLAGICTTTSYEGQAPMMLEALCSPLDLYVDIELESEDNLLIMNWEPLVSAMLDSTLSSSAHASLFHASLAHALHRTAKMMREQHGVNDVSFAGGVFQNRVLTEQAMALLTADGFAVHLPERIPLNDAGISFGQVMEHGYTCKQ
jgi:hydrogenase maturation protein HypF